jgi:hypothetical protein
VAAAAHPLHMLAGIAHLWIDTSASRSAISPGVRGGAPNVRSTVQRRAGLRKRTSGCQS